MCALIGSVECLGRLDERVLVACVADVSIHRSIDCVAEVLIATAGGRRSEEQIEGFLSRNFGKLPKRSGRSAFIGTEI